MIAVLRASHVSALAPVCDVLVEEGILSLELTLTTPGLLDCAVRIWSSRYADRRRCRRRHCAQHQPTPRRAIDSGAQYLVTPTMNLPVIELAVAAARSRSSLAG